jgi:hypothetical protein
MKSAPGLKIQVKNPSDPLTEETGVSCLKFTLYPKITWRRECHVLTETPGMRAWQHTTFRACAIIWASFFCKFQGYRLHDSGSSSDLRGTARREENLPLERVNDLRQATRRPHCNAAHTRSIMLRKFCATQVCPFTIKSNSTIHGQSCCATWLIVYGPLYIEVLCDRSQLGT